MISNYLETIKILLNGANHVTKAHITRDCDNLMIVKLLIEYDVSQRQASLSVIFILQRLKVSKIINNITLLNTKN